MIKDQIVLKEGPRYRALADALEDAIKKGDIKAGSKLPPQRDLAFDLGVTIGTVGRAYQLLTQRGFVSGEVGRGTYVSPREEQTPLHVISDDHASLHDLTYNLPMPVPSATELGQLIAELMAEPGASSYLSSYFVPPNDIAMAQAVDQWFDIHQLEMISNDILLTCGAQSAMAACLTSLSRPNDRVLLEQLCYPGFANLSRRLGLHAEGIMIDDEGIVPDALEAHLRQHRSGILLISPNAQNPTCAQMSLERRVQVAELARKHDLTIIEDDVYGALVDNKPPSLAVLAPERTVYIGSFSKFIAPGLRMGFVVAQNAILPRIKRAHSDLMLATPTFYREIFIQSVQSGLISRALSEQRRLIEARQQMLRPLITQATILNPIMSPHLWLGLNNGWSADHLSWQLASEQIKIVPSRAFAVSGRTDLEAIRVSIGRYGDEEIALLIRQIDQSLKVNARRQFVI